MISVFMRFPNHRLFPADRRRLPQRQIWRSFVRSVQQLLARTEDQVSPNQSIESGV
jgi:hypothetical protein